jgi:hypothetical protein
MKRTLLALLLLFAAVAAYAAQTLGGVAIKTGDSASIDASARLRVSNTYGLFEDTRIDGIGDMVWESSVSGASSVSTWNPNESTVSLTVGTGSGDYVIRQTRYIPYIAGASQLVKMTFLSGPDVTNTAKREGQFDDKDGLFFQHLGSTISMCVRTSTSGSPVDTCYDQANWNLDKLDGTGGSGITLDLTKVQLLLIDYIWQGVGRVRFGFLIDGQVHYVHQVMNANNISLPFMSQATLPLRYEIRNGGASTGGTLKQICVSVESEDGYLLPGYEFAASNGVTPVAITTRAPVLALRLKTSFNGKPNRKTLKLLHQTFRVATNDAFCELEHVHSPYTATGGTWVSVSNDSAAEYNVGLTSVSATATHVIDTNFLIAGQGSFAGSDEASLNYVNYHNLINQNIASTQSGMFVLYCTAYAGTSNISSEFNWIEFK